MAFSACSAGSTGIGHVRYPTAGSASAQEAQPFFVNSPLGIYLIHNGNLTNTDTLRKGLEGSQSFFNRHLRTDSDSEVLPHTTNHSLKANQTLAQIRRYFPAQPAGFLASFVFRQARQDTDATQAEAWQAN